MMRCIKNPSNIQEIAIGFHTLTIFVKNYYKSDQVPIRIKQLKIFYIQLKTKEG